MKTKEPTVSSNPYSDIEVKYKSENIIIKKIVDNFFKNFDNFLKFKTPPKRIIEVGAGEGFLSRILAIKFPSSKIIVSDISIDEENTRIHNLKQFKNVKTLITDVKNLKFPNNYFDLVLCSEVLEHIKNPKKAIDEIFRVTNKYSLLSVPEEPLWKILNMIRGKYISSFGNTPGHVNHWSTKEFTNFIKKSGFKIKKLKKCLPWTLILAKK